MARLARGQRAHFAHPAPDRRLERLKYEPQPVRCSDGFQRPRAQCMQLEDGTYVPKASMA
jgi:hypothetical protein